MNIYIYIYIYFFFLPVSISKPSISSTLSMHSRNLIGLFFFASFNQFWVQIRASTVLKDSELQNESKTCPPVLNANSNAFVKTRIANTSRAIWERTRYLEEFIFHYIKMSKSSKSGSLEDSNKYLSNSYLLSTLFSSAKCYLNLLL